MKKRAIKTKIKNSHPVVSSDKPVGAVIIGGHFQGLGLLRALGEKKVPVYLLDTSQCIGRFSKYTTKFFKCPGAEEEAACLDFLTSLAEKDNLRGWIIYPNDDETACFLARHKNKLEEYYRISTPSWETYRYAYDKMLTYQLAEKLGIAIPKTYYIKSIAELQQVDINFPVILKPSVKEPFYTRTLKKAIRIDDRAQLIEKYKQVVSYLEPSQSLMVQELITGGTNSLYSVGCLFNNGELLADVVVKRIRQHPMDFGHATTFARTMDIGELEETAKKILAAMNYRGLAEVEFMHDVRDGKYKLLEVNARIWGWHTIAIGAGVNLPYLSYLDILGKEVKQAGFIKGINWIRLATDIPTAIIEILKGRMKIGAYLRSLRGKKQFAVWSFKDPMPFIVELIMLPYLWRKRGF